MNDINKDEIDARWHMLVWRMMIVICSISFVIAWILFGVYRVDKSIGAGAYIVTTFVKGMVGFDKNTGSQVNEAGDGWGYYDLGLQNDNLLLKAAELGLDTLVMGIRDGEALRELLNIPDSENVVSVIAVGYRGQEPPERPKRKELDAVAKFI